MCHPQRNRMASVYRAGISQLCHLDDWWRQNWKWLIEWMGDWRQPWTSPPPPPPPAKALRKIGIRDDGGREGRKRGGRGWGEGRRGGAEGVGQGMIPTVPCACVEEEGNPGGSQGCRNACLGVRVVRGLAQLKVRFTKVIALIVCNRFSKTSGSTRWVHMVSVLALRWKRVWEPFIVQLYWSDS